MDSIFIQIPAYHDLELVNTVFSAIYSSSSKNYLHFGIHFNYYDVLPAQIENIKKLENPFCKIDIKFSRAPINIGMQKSRAIANSFYDGEDYYLQTDSHMHFRQNWDEIMIKNMLDVSRSNGGKNAITFFGLSYDNSNDPRKDIWGDIGDSLNSNLSLNENEYGIFSRACNKTLKLKPLPECLHNDKTRNFYNQITGAFVFVSGDYSRLITGFPQISVGEEMITSIKLITNGYNITGCSTPVAKHLAQHQWWKSEDALYNKKTDGYEKMILEYPRRIARVDFPEEFYEQDTNLENACRILSENDKYKCITGKHGDFYDWVEISNLILEGYNDDFAGWK